MRIVVVYRSESDHAREVTDFLRDFSRQTGEVLEEMDPDSREGNNFCEVYDIVEYPTIIALSDSGQMQNMWRGRPLPTISEVSCFGAVGVLYAVYRGAYISKEFSCGTEL